MTESPRRSKPRPAVAFMTLHDLVNRLPVRAHDFRHLGGIAASLQLDDGRLCQQFGDAFATVCPRHRDLLDAPVPMLHTRDICLDDGFKLAGVQLPPVPLGPPVQGCRLLGFGMRPLGHPVHLRRDDNPLGLRAEFHAHDLPWRGNTKNLTVKTGALHRANLAAPGHLLQEFPPNPIKSL